MRSDRLQHSELRFVEIARALMLRPSFLLLDEPAAGLSVEEIKRLGDLIVTISRRGTGVLLVEHHADLIFDICDRVTVLNLGQGARFGNARRNPQRTGRSSMPTSAREPLLEISGLVCRLRQDRRAQRHRPDRRRGRDRGAARPEWRRQDHVAAGDLGPAALVGAESVLPARILPAPARAIRCARDSSTWSRGTACSRN